MAVKTKRKVSKETAEKRKKARNEKTAALLERLQTAIVEICTGEDWLRLLAFQSAFHEYSFKNILLILSQCPGAVQVAGYRTWEQLGRNVRKGEKGIGIMAPWMLKNKKEGKEVVDVAPSPLVLDADNDGRPLVIDLDEDGKRLVGFRVVYVFDLTQTEGEELPTLAHKLTGGDEVAARAAFAKLREFSEKTLNVPVSIEAIEGAANGYLSLVQRRIVVSDLLEPVQAAKTLAHEIGHAILHLDSADVHDTATKEVEAESVAYCVLDAMGFDTSDYSFGYVAGWSGGDPARVQAAAANVSRAVSQVLAAVLSDEGEELSAAA